MVWPVSKSYQGNTYDLVETKTPNGYHGGFEQKGITLANDGQTFDYTVSNKLNKGTISVHKFDQDKAVSSCWCRVYTNRQ